MKHGFRPRRSYQFDDYVALGRRWEAAQKLRGVTHALKVGDRLLVSKALYELVQQQANPGAIPASDPLAGYSGLLSFGLEIIVSHHLPMRGPDPMTPRQTKRAMYRAKEMARRERERAKPY